MAHPIEWLTGCLRWIPSFWTNWSLAVFLMDTFWGVHPDYLPSVKLMLCVSSSGGLWITCVKQKLVIRGFFPVDIRLSGLSLVAADIVAHQVPLYVFIKRTPYEHTHGSHIPCYALLILYMLLNDPAQRYRMRLHEIVGGVVFAHGMKTLL